MSTPTLSQVSLTSFYDPYDGSVVQAKLFFYKAGTLDPQTVWTDPEGSIPYAQPVLTGGSGRVPPVWLLDEVRYRIRAFDQYDVLLEDIDNMPGATPDASDPVEPEPVDPALLLQTGDIFAAFSNAAVRVGAVRCNGLTIGSQTSGATERANADTEALFKHLWQQDTANMLQVLPSKGASSDGDWTANKQITVPDLRGRVLVGMDPMGNTAATTRMDGATIDAGTVSVPGCNGGRAAKTLAIAEIPSHNHTLHDPGHTHTVYDPTHGHYVNDPWHNHGMNRETFQVPPAGGAYRVNGPGSNIHTDIAPTGIWNSGAGTGISLYAIGTGIWIDAVGGDPDAGGATKRFSMVPPFLTTTFYIKL